MKQHYVPECYLNEFCSTDGRLMTLDILALTKYKKTNIKPMYPSQLGYEMDFYTLDVPMPPPYQHLTKRRPYLIEKDIFWRYEQEYPAILEQIRNRRHLIRKQAELLIYSLVSMKMRNKYLLDAVRQKHRFNRIISQDKEDIIEKSMILFPHMSRQEKLEAIAKVEQIVNTDDFIKAANLIGIIDRETKNDSIIVDITTTLFNCEWTIIETDFSAMFVTTDNPGYCVDSHSIPFNTKFADCTFTFPLTPAFCLLINNKRSDYSMSDDVLFKSIQYETADKKTISTINARSTLFCNRYVVGQSKQTIETLLSNVQRKHEY